ncbi:type IV toxin-antitoxin system AbiEi family antitoxin [Bifidobacterium cuniculi]|nr:hypothetical protein [Bifidobacterium cuniculi]
MRRDLALSKLSDMDRRLRLYVYRKADLSVPFGEHGAALTRTVTSLCSAGILERAAHGVYVYTYSERIGEGTLDEVARCLRPGRITWESLESALSQYGVISQIPMGRVTYMTTGRSGLFPTRFGTAELTHSKLSAAAILPGLVMRRGRLPIAAKMFAYRNLKDVGRNLHLVDEEELYWDEDE